MAEDELFRVAVVYSSDDDGLVEKIVSALENNGVAPMCASHSEGAAGHFSEPLRSISHAHLLMPVVSEHSKDQSWLHQEIGFAYALNIPVLPATTKLETDLTRFVKCLKPITLDPERLVDQLTMDSLLSRINNGRTRHEALFECAEKHEDRTAKIAEYVQELDQIRSGLTINRRSPTSGHGPLRQRGGLTSFNIPMDETDHPRWRWRHEQDGFPGEQIRNLQRKERLALERLVDHGGARLVIDCTSYSYLRIESQIVRFDTVIEFLESTQRDDVCVALENSDKFDQLSRMKSRVDRRESVTIAGNWFFAESVKSEIQSGYRQTVLTRHAPTIEKKVKQFDDDFSRLLIQQSVRADESKAHAIETLKRIIAFLLIPMDPGAYRKLCVDFPRFAKIPDYL